MKSNGSLNSETEVIELNSGYSQTKKIKISPNKFIMFLHKVVGIESIQEIWESNGSTLGTKKIFELKSDANYYFRQESSLIGNKLYFNGVDLATGNELYVLDFSCPNNIVISTVIENNATYRANSKIELSSEIKAISNVNLEANNQIILKPGTNINSNNVFKAEIRNCQN